MPDIRVRFAPSPTGPLHIGGVRTALFNYLFAKKNNGIFYLRIEDTDQSRYIPGAEEYIYESLKWLGINVDEGVKEGGNYGPYKQSERKDIYKKYADHLLENGWAYYAFDTPGELDKLRNEYEANKQTFAYGQSNRNILNNSLKLNKEKLKKKLNSNIPYVIRFKMPENREIEMNDMIRGKVKINTSTLDDKVIFKSDGLPTYHLANIVDDHLMKTSHVIRGEEWLPSLPLHVMLYTAFGWKNEMPEFAHLPLILKPGGNGKLSKRDGDKEGFPVFPVEWKSPDGEVYSGYREAGYFPEAVINILAFLGWNPGTEKEIYSLNELINDFSLEKVGKSGARFDPEKAKWFNQHYLKEKSNTELAELFQPFLLKKSITIDIKKTEKIISLVKDRACFINDLWNQSYYFFQTPETYDEKVIKKFWKENTAECISDILKIIKNVEQFNAVNTENAVVKYVEVNELCFGKVMNPLRLAIVGEMFGPHLFDIIEIIGKEETVKRIERALQILK